MHDHITPEGMSVLDDLGRSADEAVNLKIRARLMDALVDLVRKRGWNQMQAGEALNVGQGRVSDLMNGRISKFTIDALVKMCTHAGIEVDLMLATEHA